MELTSARVLTALSHEFIDEQVEKCRQKTANGDHAGAVTNARTMVEAVLLGLEHELFESPGDSKGDLPRLYKRVCSKLNLETGRPGLGGPLRQMLSGLSSIVNGLAALRNRASDAHATRYRTREHHARVAVNAAMTLTDFLLATYEYQRGIRGPDGLVRAGVCSDRGELRRLLVLIDGRLIPDETLDGLFEDVARAGFSDDQFNSLFEIGLVEVVPQDVDDSGLPDALRCDYWDVIRVTSLGTKVVAENPPPAG